MNSARALWIVRRFFPKVTTVQDAKKPTIVIVN